MVDRVRGPAHREGADPRRRCRQGRDRGRPSTGSNPTSSPSMTVRAGTTSAGFERMSADRSDTRPSVEALEWRARHRTAQYAPSMSSPRDAAEQTVLCRLREAMADMRGGRQRPADSARPARSDGADDSRCSSTGAAVVTASLRMNTMVSTAMPGRQRSGRAVASTSRSMFVSIQRAATAAHPAPCPRRAPGARPDLVGCSPRLAKPC